MDTLIQDLRVGWRALRRSPGFALVAVAIIALGIAINTIAFTMVYGVLGRPLPIPHPERVVLIAQSRPSRPGSWYAPSPPNFRDFRARALSFERMGAWFEPNGNVNFGREPERMSVSSVTWDLFPTLGIQPALGRGFQPEENDIGRNWTSVVISHRVWVERYGSDPRVLGRTLRVNGRTRTIVGVMPRGFHWPRNQDLWFPMGFEPARETRDGYGMMTVGRLRQGVNLRQASAELASIMATIARDHPLPGEAVSASARPYRETLMSDVAPVMILIQIAVGFVLLIACANVANLMLARAAGRRREIGLRMALGASRVRVLRQLLTESLLVAVMGGVVGVLLAHWGFRAWMSLVPVKTLHYWMRFDMDGPILAFTAGAAVLSAILFGLAPALHATDLRLGEALHEGSVQSGASRSRNRLRSALVVAEVALSIVLLVGTGLMVRSFLRTTALESSVRSEGVFTAGVLLPAATYPGDGSRREFYRQSLRRIEALPGVTGAAAVSDLPLSAGAGSVNVAAEGASAAEMGRGREANFALCTPGYFRVVGLPLRSGRDFASGDDSTTAPVAIVTETLARRLWPAKDPLGRRFALVPADSVVWRTVVGVVRDVMQSTQGDRNLAVVFVPHAQQPWQFMSLVVHSRGEVGALSARVREVLRTMNPDLPLINARSMREHIRFEMWDQRLYVLMLSCYSMVALLLAAAGIYGVMAYTVAQRTQEIGIRMALGAAGDAVVRMIVGQALRLTVIGAAIGLAGALALTRLMASLLYQVRPEDPPTYLTVTIVLGGTALLAAWLPARRATRVDPMVALRSE